MRLFPIEKWLLYEGLTNFDEGEGKCKHEYEELLMATQLNWTMVNV